MLVEAFYLLLSRLGPPVAGDPPYIRVWVLGLTNQFMLGPSILVTPVLQPLARDVKGVFPGVGSGTRWYDWYNLTEVHAAAGENVTVDAPLVHIPVFLRGGAIVPSQAPGKTTKQTSANWWSVTIALDQYSKNATKEIDLRFDGNALKTTVTSSYNDANPMANVTIAGWNNSKPCRVLLSIAGTSKDTSGVSASLNGTTLLLRNFQSITQDGVWAGDMNLKLPTACSASRPGRG